MRDKGTGDSMDLQQLIDEIEDQKGIIRRVEYEPLQRDYVASKYRQHSMTKRECEMKLSRLTGELLGMEHALSVLYKEVSKGTA